MAAIHDIETKWLKLAFSSAEGAGERMSQAQIRGSQKEPTVRLNQNMVNSPVDVCAICGEGMAESHACLHDVPASLLTLQDPRLGTIFGECYLLEDYVSTGDTCFVYKARHQLLNTYVAAKIPCVPVTADPFCILRAQRAAQIASRLDHPQIARTIELICPTEDAPLLVMEWTEGKPLTEIIAREAPLTPVRAVHLLEQILSALTYARLQGINHIRLKTSAILVQALPIGERIKLLDFGIMKMLVAQKPSAVSDCSPYRSPEELRGIAPDERSAIYSVGVLFYEMLTEKFDSLLEGNSELPPLVKVRPDLPESSHLDDVIFKCMATAPDQRYSSLAELTDAVSNLKIEMERFALSRNDSGDYSGTANPNSAFIELLLIVIIVVALMVAWIGLRNVLPIG